MKEKGEMINRFVIGCFTILFLGFISIVYLQAQDQEKEAKKKTYNKSEQIKSNPAVEQTEKEVKENIKPPEGEQWVAPGDEELYKFDINPITPNEGITGGIFIYLGHYVRPPYKVEARDIIKDGKFVEVEGKINGIQVTPIPLSIKEKFCKQVKKSEIILTEEEKECYKKSAIFHDSIFRDVKNIGKKISLKSENIGKIEEEIRKYLESRPEIISIGKVSIWEAEITFKICNIQTEDFWFSWDDETSKEKEFERWKEGYEMVLKHFGSVNYFWFDVVSSSNQDDINQITRILSSDKTKEEKIKLIYKVTENIKYAKLLFYNFNYLQYMEDRRSGLVK